MNSVKAYGVNGGTVPVTLKFGARQRRVVSFKPCRCTARKNERRQCRLHSPSRQLQVEPTTLVIAVIEI